MEITLTIPFEDAVDMMAESPLFRRSVLYHLSNNQDQARPIQEKKAGQVWTDEGEKTSLHRLTNYVKCGFVWDTRSSAIKYVRDWVNLQKSLLSPETYNLLSSFVGARKFVVECLISK